MASYLQRSLSAQVNGVGGVQMPPLTSENSHFLWSGPQEATLVMVSRINLVVIPLHFAFEVAADLVE